MSKHLNYAPDERRPPKPQEGQKVQVRGVTIGEITDVRYVIDAPGIEERLQKLKDQGR